jgi:putative ABC transport system permease protein
MEKKGTFARFNPDKAAYIPITTMAIRLIGRQNEQGIPIDYADVSAVDKASIPTAIYQIRNILRWRSGKEDFAIQTNQPFLDLIFQIGNVLTIFLGTVSGISLLVGGIGIMNVMLVTVAERTSEIGLRKAIGARSSSILIQFLLEAVIMSTIGGAVGIVIGLTGSQAIGRFSPIKAPVPAWAIVLSLGISSGVGIVFGIIPAKNAAKLEPIKALRSY